jgi:hypothetical protein
MFIGAFVNAMYGGKSNDSHTEHSDVRKALKAFSQFKVDHYSDKGTFPNMNEVSTLEFMFYWLEQHKSEYSPSLAKSPFVNMENTSNYGKNTETQTQSASEWNGHHITHPYQRFISLHIHHHANSTNYSDKVPFNTNQVFKEAVESWREKTHIVINGKSQKWRPTVANVDSWFGIETNENDDNSSMDPEDYHTVENEEAD